jgi:hypothetical protein
MLASIRYVSTSLSVRPSICKNFINLETICRLDLPPFANYLREGRLQGAWPMAKQMYFWWSGDFLSKVTFQGKKKNA